jgi:hypothetical protein
MHKEPFLGDSALDIFARELDPFRLEIENAQPRMVLTFASLREILLTSIRPPASPFSLAYFPATSTGVSATETGDRRSIKETKNAIPMTIPPIKNGVLP